MGALAAPRSHLASRLHQPTSSGPARSSLIGAAKIGINLVASFWADTDPVTPSQFPPWSPPARTWSVERRLCLASRNKVLAQKSDKKGALKSRTDNTRAA